MPPKFSRELKSPISFDRVVPEDQPRTSPCEANCPAGHAIQRTIYLIQNNRFEEALENVRAKNPFPGVCGRACFHPCELPCNRHLYDQGISVRALERAASDLSEGRKVKKPRRREKTHKKVSIIGSGPAGMTCAYFSALFGHEVTVYEALPVLGGMPRFGIPDYRLPKDIADREVNEVLKHGVIAKPNTAVGRDISFQEITGQSDACLIATGAWKGKGLSIPGSDLALSALPFLREAKSGGRLELGKRVVVVGGGGVAFDCAGTARRCGANEVHIACPEPRDQMLAPVVDIEQGEEEGIIIHNSVAFKGILMEKGRVTGIECVGIRSFRFDEAGELHVDITPGTEHVLHADTVILAIGERPDFGFLDGIRGFGFTKQGTLEVDPTTLVTPVKGVFASGDAVTGPSSIAEAIGGGRRAAVSIDCYLSGKRMDGIRSVYINSQGYVVTEEFAPPEPKAMTPHVVTYEELMNPEYYEKEDRVEMEHLTQEQSLRGFKEINKGYTREQAIKEANRCFHCGHCSMCGNCVELCPMDVLAMGDWGPEVAYPDECWHCGGCRINCPCAAVYYEFPLAMLI